MVQEDNFTHLTMVNLEGFLLVLTATNLLDTKTKNMVKKKVRDELDLVQQLPSDVLPQMMELFATSDLKESNPYYGEYCLPNELLYLKMIFGLRASEFDDSPKFEVYKDMHRVVMSDASKLKKVELGRLIDALCMVEVPIETFQYSMLEKALEGTLDKGQKSLDVMCRMCVMYGVIGIDNMRKKWLEKCLGALRGGAVFGGRNLFDIFVSIRHNEECDRETILKVYEELDSKKNGMGVSKRIILLYTAARLGIEVKFDPKWQIPGNLKTLDMVLLSFLPSYRRVTYDFEEEKILSFYRHVYQHNSIVRENDSSSVYKSLHDKQRDDCTRDVLLKTNDVVLYLPHMNKKNKQVYMVYRNDLFLNNMNIVPLSGQQYKYRLEQIGDLNVFYDVLHAHLTNAGLKVLKFNVKDC